MQSAPIINVQTLPLSPVAASSPCFSLLLVGDPAPAQPSHHPRFPPHLLFGLGLETSGPIGDSFAGTWGMVQGTALCGDAIQLRVVGGSLYPPTGGLGLKTFWPVLGTLGIRMSLLIIQ
jgi:hypothetical protein